jgi:hypothetical protein
MLSFAIGRSQVIIPSISAVIAAIAGNADNAEHIKSLFHLYLYHV